MVLSRFPILTVRGHLLPRSLRPGGINLQRGALEVVIAAPGGPLRLYCVHLDHVDADERVAQIAALKDIAFAMPVRGGAVSDVTALGFAEPPLPDGFMVAGDFNLEPSSREQTALLRDGGMLIDCSAGDDGWSWTDPKDRAITQRLDYVVATPDLAARIVDVTIDREADGSDHMPLWFTLV
jgi:endonuclease/exonuclease/phosphatase family metal-dependent hydrolase